MRNASAAMGLLLMIAACGPPRIRIDWNRPPVLAIATTQTLAVQVVSDGTPQNADTVIDGIFSATQGQLMNKWLAVPPVRAEFLAQLRGAGYAVVEAPQGELTVRVRPTRWSFQVTSGKSHTTGSGRLDALIEVFDARNATAQPIYSDTFWATGSGRNLGEPESMLRASYQLAAAFLRELQPQRVSAQVVLDDSDPVTEPGIALCKEGSFDAAYAAFTDAVGRSPNSAPAHYDLALMAEAHGDYDLAESLLVKATGLSPNPNYYKALERVRGARQDSAAMKGPREAAPQLPPQP